MEMNQTEHALKMALQSVRDAHQADLEMQRQQHDQNSIVLHDQIKSLEVKIASLTSENGRLSSKYNLMERRNDRKNTRLQEQIKSLEEQNKKLSKGRDHRTFN